MSKYEKYEKMKKMLPEGAVRQKMQMDGGFTPEEIDAFMSGNPLPPTSTASATPAAAVGPDLSRFEKYEKMRKMLPEGAVRQKMKMDNFTDVEIDAMYAGTLASLGSSASGAAVDLKSALKGSAAGGAANAASRSGKNVNFTKPATPAVPTRQPVYNVKMKNIYWNKLTETDIKQTFWAREKHYSLNEAIKKELEEWFAAKPSKDLALAANVALAATRLSHGASLLSSLFLSFSLSFFLSCRLPYSFHCENTKT
jgi:hypothetical protein